jgi:hypothetical protein
VIEPAGRWRFSATVAGNPVGADIENPARYDASRPASVLELALLAVPRCPDAAGAGGTGGGAW